MPETPAVPTLEPRDFIREIVLEDLKSGKHDHVVTRFPPEPNGYLHIGHAKAFCLDFGLALEVPGSRCHLRMDDTNPVKEDVEYVESIQEDVRWMGFDWGQHFYYASDYYEQLHGHAVELIEKGLAYVDELTADQMREFRGTLTEPGKESPFRNRTVAENLDLFAKMRAGAFEEGAAVLRAKIDMAHPNVIMRDPTLYRVLKTHHHRTGDAWCIYPMYDFAHPLSDAIEGITHSLCSLEFENHRPLYDWFVSHCSVPARPRQIEFARLNLTYTVMSKRKLQQLVAEKLVDGWDDPRMPTLSGLRRRGYTPAAIRKFIETIGLTKFNSLTDVALLEHAIRNDLNASAPRVMAVLDPIRVVITSYPQDQTEEMEALINPEDPSLGSRIVPFSRELYIERDDFMENAPKNYFRLTVGQEVRLRYGYWIKCEEVVKDAGGNIVELRCSHDPATRGGENPPDGRKVKGTIHWVSAAHALPAEVRLYDRLFTVEQVGDDFTSLLNPDSLKVIPNAMLEPGLARAQPGDRVQFERIGYFCVDPKLSKPGHPVFNRTVALKDTWAKVKA
ncbi:MAG: glutamine--tRNA ligase/YqeY domain fusion protein [Verrucomicrobia bacterium]|nr:glutamine--tRNA ligase/YqeY domain fusion protein [Verrucomicrobiota bacterium]